MSLAKVGDNMYTTKIVNAKTPISLFCGRHIQSENETESSLPSRREIAFLLDSAASIPVVEIPSYTTFNDMFNVCSQDQHYISKMFRIANQFESPINKFYFCSLILICRKRSRDNS